MLSSTVNHEDINRSSQVDVFVRNVVIEVVFKLACSETDRFVSICCLLSSRAKLGP